MTVSKDDQKIGLVIGKKLIKGINEITELAIYSRNAQNNYKFELERLREFNKQDVCIQFHFNDQNT